MADLKTQLVMTADASGVEAGVNKAKRSLAGLGDAAKREGEKASDGFKGVGDDAGKASAKVDSATRSLIGSIQRTTAALEAGSKSSSGYYAALAQQRGVSVDTLKPYLAQLDAVSSKQKIAQVAIASTAQPLDRLGISAKQTAAALRGVPAQFTDIFTSIAAGQNPLQVFLQQGGQLKDMFGGAGPAAKALGGYIVGLINPFTIAAAAVVALGVAYAQGSKEADAYAKALILSGNAAGTTVGQLTEMAKAIDGVVGTQSAAAAALAEFAASGKIAAGSIENFTVVALKMERETGQAVSETVKQFEELGKSPVEAAVKLNEKTNFLTESIYRQIKSLEEQGRTAEAASTAQKAYADALDSRLGQLEGRLGYIERAWRGIKGAAAEAWDSMLGVGRADTLQEQLGKAQAQLAQRQQRGPLSALGDKADGAYQKGNQALKDRIANLSETINLENKAATASAAAASQVKARIAFDQEADKYLDKKVQKTREIAKANALADKAGASAAERAKLIAGIEDKFKEKGGKKPRDTTRVDASAQAKLDVEGIQARAAEATNTIVNTERILEAERAAGLVNESDYYAKKKALLEDNTRIQVEALQAENNRLEQQSLNTKDALDRDRAVLVNKQKIAKLQADATTQQTILDIQSASALKSLEKALLSARQAAQDYFDTLNRQQQREIDAFGKGDRQRNLDSGINQIEDRYANQKRDLENNKAQLELEGRFTDEARKQYDERLAIINDFQAKSVQSYIDGFAQIEAAQRDWQKGALEALNNYADAASKTGLLVDDALTSSFQSIEDALTQLVTTGKLDFKSLADSIIAEFARIAIKQSITGPLASAFSSLIGGASSSSGGGGGDVLGAFISGLGARAIGGPVSAGGMYRVNERGPEVLSVGSKDYLMMGSQGGSVSPNAGASEGAAPITVYYQAQPGESRKTAAQNGRALAEQLATNQRKNS